MAEGGGLLDEKDCATLESWIGDGPKQFTLLYKITRDKCDVSTFHEKCDKQGPTVTVLYNPHGTVYGGYTSESWSDNRGWITDEEAFLFQLKYNKEPSNRRFPVKAGREIYAVYAHHSYGPAFGGRNDLPSFRGRVRKPGGIFTLNSTMNFNNTYDFQELTADEINNDTKAVTELEVYKITDGESPEILAAKRKPWRETPAWDEQYLTDLQELVANYEPVSSPRMPQARILMVGPAGSGKSSFYNTINSVFQERITHKAIIGSSNRSLTNRYTQYHVRTVSEEKLNFRLCDTRGLEENIGTDTTEFGYLLDGHIPNYYEFDPEGTKLHCLVKSPTVAEQIHCVAFILDATTLDVMSPAIIKKIKTFQNQSYKRGIPQVLLLTKTDELCEFTKHDPEAMLKSEDVENTVKAASDMFGITPGNVIPVRNYVDEMELNDKVSISAMLALRHMLHFADEFLDYQRDKDAVENGLPSPDIK